LEHTAIVSYQGIYQICHWLLYHLNIVQELLPFPFDSSALMLQLRILLVGENLVTMHSNLT
jgi:hypothetical protein